MVTDLITWQVTFEVWGGFFSLVCAAIVYLSITKEGRREKFLTAMLLVNALELFCDSYSFILKPESRTLLQAINVCTFIVFACSMLLALLCIYYIGAILKERGIRIHRHWYLVGLLSAILFYLFLILTPKFGFYYAFPNNSYQQGDLYWISVGSVFIVLLELGYLVIYYRMQMTVAEVVSFLAIIIIPVIASFLVFLFPSVSIGNLASTCSVLLMSIVHSVDKNYKSNEREKLLLLRDAEMAEQRAILAQKDAELAEKRNQLAVSQIKPHFIFNVLGSIEQLCRSNPEKAAEATHHFARYMRTNLNALSSSDLIRFSDELKHIHTYIELEKMRFGDDFEYIEKVAAVDFLLPPLSIQPIVENAIKHGMMGTDDLLTVILKTEETEDAYHVTVSDDGCGFDPNQTREDGTIHLGLENVRGRIGMLCGGTVRVASKLGDGTTVVISIPKQNSPENP